MDFRQSRWMFLGKRDRRNTQRDWVRGAEEKNTLFIVRYYKWLWKGKESNFTAVQSFLRHLHNLTYLQKLCAVFWLKTRGSVPKADVLKGETSGWLQIQGRDSNPHILSRIWWFSGIFTSEGVKKEKHLFYVSWVDAYDVLNLLENVTFFPINKE